MIRFLILPVALAALIACSTEKKVDCAAERAAAKAQLEKAHAAMMEAGAMSMKYPIDIDVLVDKHRLVLKPGVSYDLRIASADSDRFVIEARGKGTMTGDVWRIDEKGAITALSEKCPQP
jgi:hypothetical protein